MLHIKELEVVIQEQLLLDHLQLQRGLFPGGEEVGGNTLASQ